MGSDPKIRRILCQRLLQLRHENNLTQAELSSLSAIPQPVLSLYENQGSSRSPTLYALVRLANALNVSTDYLLGRTDDKSGAKEFDLRRLGYITAFKKRPSSPAQSC